MLRIASLPGSAAAAAILMSTFTAIPASAAGSPLGVWLDDTGRGAVEITECSGALCGKVVWVKSKSDAKGCGANILGGVRPVGGGSWDNGWIYSPEHGRKFDVALTPVGSDRLRVTGYAGIKLFSENRTWTRAPADLPRCDSPETVAGTKTPQASAATAKVDTAAASTTSEAITAPPPRPASPPAVRIAKQEPAPASAAPPASTGTSETAPAPSSATPKDDETGTAAAPADGSAANTETADGAAPEGASPNSGGLSFDKLVKKSADGSCKLDLPWVKIKFDCKKL
ncbi:MAG: DUF2147 domain-containing protein [Hyphomicrobiaceae bacterium]